MKIIKLKENEANQVPFDLVIAERYIEFLHTKDSFELKDIQDFCDKQQMSLEVLTEILSDILQAFFCGGKSKGERIGVEEFERKKGILIEFEHCNKESLYADLIATKIMYDHEFEFLNNYYLTGIDLVGQEEKVKSLMSQES